MKFYTRTSTCISALIRLYNVFVLLECCIVRKEAVRAGIVEVKVCALLELCEEDVPTLAALWTAGVAAGVGGSLARAGLLLPPSRPLLRASRPASASESAVRARFRAGVACERQQPHRNVRSGLDESERATGWRVTDGPGAGRL